MISFSSKYFYDDTLQVMKIRGLMDEIIVFEFIDHDNKSDPTKNTNSLEAKHIVKELERLLMMKLINCWCYYTTYRAANIFDKFDL